MRALIKRHYHWVIASIVLLEMFVYVGILNNIVSVYVIPVSETLGISRGDYSLAFSAKAMAGAISVVVSGPFLRRVGYRKMVSFFLLVAVAAFFILSTSRNLFMLFLGAILIGLCEGSCLTAGASNIIGSWFHRYCGSVLGLVTAATGVGGSVMCSLLTKIISGAGWRISFAVCGVMTAAVAIIIGLLARDYPHLLGQKPLGEGEHAKNKSEKKQDDHWHGYSMEKLLRMPSFYLTALEVFLSCLCVYIAFYVMVPYLQSRGFTTSEAATMQSIMLLGMAGFKLLSGVLSDWIGAKCATGLCLAATVASFWLLITANTYSSALLAVLVFSLALPLTTVTIPLLTASLFGYSTHNTTLGIFLAMPAAAGMVAAPITNMVFDKTGSYLPAFRAALILSTAVFLLHVFICILASRDRRQLEREEVLVQ